MLTLFSRHGLFDLTVMGKGDIEVDFHHTVEDVGSASGRRSGGPWGHEGDREVRARGRPMIEALAAVTVDISARPHLVYHVPLNSEKVGSSTWSSWRSSSGPSRSRRASACT